MYVFVGNLFVDGCVCVCWSLWTILRYHGNLRKFVEMIHLLHGRFSRTGPYSGNMSAAFAISNGVKQSYVLAPVLFSLFFICILSHAIQCLKEGLYILYQLDALFDFEHTGEVTPYNHPRNFCWWLCPPGEETQWSTVDAEQILITATMLFGLVISLNKTCVLYRPVPNSNSIKPKITIDDTQLSNVNSLKFLGNISFNDGQRNWLQEQISNDSQALE